MGLRQRLPSVESCFNHPAMVLLGGSIVKMTCTKCWAAILAILLTYLLTVSYAHVRITLAVGRPPLIYILARARKSLYPIFRGRLRQ